MAASAGRSSAVVAKPDTTVWAMAVQRHDEEIERRTLELARLHHDLEVVEVTLEAPTK
jgi:hypothetical protein